MTTTTVSRGRVAAPAATRPVRRSPKYDGVWPWIFLVPILVPLAIFFIWPLLRTFYYSFTTWGFFGDVSWAGIDNYVRLFNDPDFALALGNTAIYTAIVMLNVPIAVYLAALINRPGLRFKGLYRTLYFLPVVTMPVAVAIVWRMLYSGDFGLINAFLGLFGIQGPYWLSTPGLSLVAVAIVGIWLSLGFNIIVFSAGLSSIPPDLYEAASIDGASPARQFRSITLPLLTPTIFFISVLTLIGGFQVFDLIFVMLGTGPNAARSQTLVYFFYNEGFLQNDKGYATAIGVVIIVMIAILTAIQFRLQKKWVHYE
ncbi:carbohydrate ABC transporter permease [Microbacterium sp. MYb45]|uniref:carbohydrate ABC transporter permease n=1 Tax=Microbacterium sp. MYb45 TaxID=1827294 RepID=UPI000D00D942|nr:sugar ABC transporter permease [Microbacterium sp. MYb45]PRB63562.1 sugar ABC transporter permease [Microbacterium sp. MYb45]